MDKKDLRYTFLNYFRNQIVHNQLIECKALLDIAGNPKVVKDVLEDLIKDNLIEKIEYISANDNSLGLISNEPIKLTEKGYKELLNQVESEQLTEIAKSKALTPDSEFNSSKMEQLIEHRQQISKDNIKSDIEDKNHKVLSAEDIINKECKVISKLNKTGKIINTFENSPLQKIFKQQEAINKAFNNSIVENTSGLSRPTILNKIEKYDQIHKDFNSFASQVSYLKLLYICLDGFKNLKNIEINFANLDNLLLLIGNNACGKSNILEAISAIFTEVYTRKRISNFKYELRYNINNQEIVIKRNGESPYFIINGSNVTRRQIIQDDLLPSKVIALYSGEETRLWEEYYEKFYFQYLKDLAGDSYDTFGRKMLYVNKYYWNIALLVLLLSSQDEHINFIENKLKIDKKTVEVKIDFNLDFLKKNISKELEGFIDEINPNKRKTITFSLDALTRIILPEYSSNEQIFIQKYTLEQIFEILVYASMPKFKKAFKNIEIKFNEGLSIKSLSEGEKKYILIYTVVEILADENTIILMDEPDAHIHETGKEDICNLFDLYCSNYNRQIIVTTHSPTLTHCTQDNHIIMLTNKLGCSSVVDADRKTKINKLTGGMWSEIQQNIFLNSTTPLILFEGIGDINYVKKAIEIFKNEFPKLNKLDFLPFGGASNACEFIKKIRDITNKEKKIIMIFDRDEAGQDGLGKCLPPNVFKEGVKNTKTYLDTSNNAIYLMLPMTEERKSILPQNANGKDLHFLIEDCFSSNLRKDIAQQCINETNGFFNKYTKDLKDHIKQMLTKEEYHTPDNMLGFKPLLIKIQDIIEGNEPLEKV